MLCYAKSGERTAKEEKTPTRSEERNEKGKPHEQKHKILILVRP